MGSRVRRLVLLRHSVPDIRRDVPAADWRLSPIGIARAEEFARRLDPGSATKICASHEPKATETAQAIAGVWGVGVETIAGLHEHERPEARMLSRAEFEERIRQMFARPCDLVFGTETADQARRRFTAALMRLVARSSEDIFAVTHGTVMTLFVAQTTGIEPFAFWKSLEMPSGIVLSIPDLAIIGKVALPKAALCKWTSPSCRTRSGRYSTAASSV